MTTQQSLNGSAALAADKTAPLETCGTGPRNPQNEKEFSDTYSIGELAKKANVSNRTLRYYEELGLITPKNRGSNRYRYYDESHIQRLNTIKLLQESGFALKEILAALAPILEPGSQLSYTGQEVGHKIYAALEKQRQLLMERQSEIAKTLEELNTTLAGLSQCFGCKVSKSLEHCAGCSTGPAEVRRLAEQLREFKESA